jgi:hypothetical protein
VVLCRQRTGEHKLLIRNPWITDGPREMINVAT